MADALGIETRSRSRSKTPGFENGDSGKKAKKIPTISLIEEEDDVVEVPSSQSSQGTRPKRPRRSVKAVVADTSADAPIESPKSAQKVVVSSTTTVTETVTKTINGSEEASSTTTTTKTASNGDESQSIFNNIFNAIKTSTPILSNKRSKRVTQNVSSSGPVNDADHPAYKEYREAGEYWNKFPKTDYTYSELSPHRRELSNGMVAMPNMSRKSLDKYNARVESMIHNNPLDETYIRRKFFSNTNSSFQKRSADLQYDSTDEVDVSDFRKMLQERRKQNTSVVTRFFMTFVSFFSSSFTQVKSTVFGSKQNYAYTPVRHAKQSIVSSSFDSVKRLVLTGFSKVYVFLSTILCLDTWLLHTRSDNQVENRKRKFFLLLLLALLPLLLFGALLLSDEEPFVATQLEFPVPNYATVAKFFSGISALRLPEWNFSVGWLWTPFVSLGAGLQGFLFATKSKDELKMALDEDKFQALLAHIDSYIDSAIGVRFDENNKEIVKETNEKVTRIVAGSVKDALVTYNYQLTAQDIEAIAERVRKLMEKEFTNQEKILLGKISLASEDNLVKIQEQIKQNINLHFSEIKLDNQNVDLNEILLAIFKSDKLLSIIDSRVKPAIVRLDQHDIDIEAIKVDIAKLKADVVLRFSSFGDEIKELRGQQKNFGEDFYKLKLENDEKLKQLLLDIDVKLASIGGSQFTSIDASVRKNLLDILGFDLKSSGGEMDENSIKNWIGSVFVAKDYLEDRLKHVEVNGNKAFQLQLDKNAGILMAEINEEIKKQVAVTVVAKSRETESGKVKISGGLSEAEVIKIVKGVLAVYDADKTGLVDFALESAGGQVLSTRCTENYQTKSAEISIFGIPLWYPSNTPRTVISPSVQPGECWAFQGFPGYVVVQLNNLVHVTGFTMEHIAQSLAPNGIIDSAPNNFTVWGLETEMDKDPVLFGSYHFSADENAPGLQYFPVKSDRIDQPYQIIELRVESNHGNPRYTCLYRFRVHGSTVKR